MNLEPHIQEKRWTGLLLIASTAIIAVLFVYCLPRVPQDLEYHQFADKRALLGIPNFFNVISNAGFILVGAFALRLLLRKESSPSIIVVRKEELWPYLFFYTGAILTGFGSVYYHLAPDNGTLVWDRLPMTVIFMSLLASVLSERISVKAGVYSLVPLMLAGTGSVFYWKVSEEWGMGDLRPYGFIHFYPVLVILLAFLFYPSRYTRGGDIFGVLAFYALATVSELLDKVIFDMGHVLSGHTIKHLLASAAILWHLKMLSKRQPSPKHP